jgi:adenylate kinase
MIHSNPIPAFALFGPPGCGKGTQAALIQENQKYLHVSTGDIFRTAIACQDPKALKAKELMEKGELVPDELICEMLTDQLEKNLAQSPEIKGIILDGFPRTLSQAEMLNDMLQKLNLNFKGAVSLVVPQEELVSRLLKRAEIEGRPDDTEDVIRERMRVYYEKTQPLENFFKLNDQLIEIEGIGSIEDIYNRLIPIIQSWS